MARKTIATDQIVKLIVGAGQASPAPPVGPALGSKGVKSIDFCKVIAELPRRYHRDFTETTPGVQCAYSTYDTRCPYSSTSDSPSRSLISFRTPNTYHLLSALTSSRRQGTKKQSTGRNEPGQRDYRGSFAEACLQYRKDQAVGA